MVKCVEKTALRFCAGMLLVVTAVLPGCQAKQVLGPRYLCTTGFYELGYNITKEEFLSGWQAFHNKTKGGRPVRWRMQPGIDVWEVFIYEVYDHDNPVKTPAPSVDHCEYVAFKNGRLKKYGSDDVGLTTDDVLGSLGVLAEN